MRGWCSPNDNNDNNNNCYFNGNNNFACDGNISRGIGNDYSHNGDYNVYYDGDNNYIPYNNSIPASASTATTSWTMTAASS